MSILKNVLTVCLLTLAVVLTLLYQDDAVRLWRSFKLPVKLFQPEKRKPLIVAWTAFFGDPIFSQSDVQKLKCEISECIFSTDRLLANSSDALLFHWRDINVHDIPNMKPSYQKWVLLNYESPYHVPMPVLEGFGKRPLDWTVSYRLDSDFVSSYGKSRQRLDTDPPEQNITEQDFQNKKVVAWMVSNCNSRSGREDLVRSLQKYLQVDVYGMCARNYGSKYTSVNGSLEEAYGFLAKRYKFYLAFENSLCTDYVTEKAFHPLLAGMVPVVFGLANYTKMLPPGSFINALLFKNVSELSEHLLHLSNNFTLYREYLEWRKDNVIDRAHLSQDYLCELCLRLRENRESDTGNRTRDLRSWWNVTRDCKKKYQADINF